MDEKNAENGIELKESYMVLAVPTTAVEITITAKVWVNSEVVEVHKTMQFEEIREAFKEADDGYIPSNAIFTLSDIGREQLEQLKAEHLAKSEEEDE